MALAMPGLWEGVVADADRRTDPEVVASLYRDRGPELWAFARRLGLSPDECDDAVQEAHLRLWRSIRAGQPPDDAIAWLYRVLYRISMDRHRWSRRLADLVRRWPAPSTAGDPARTQDAAVWASVDALPPRQRAIVYLHYRADLDFTRIAAVMGITPGAARTAASRGLETIRRRLADEGEVGR